MYIELSAPRDIAWKYPTWSKALLITLWQRQPKKLPLMPWLANIFPVVGVSLAGLSAYVHFF